MGAEPTTNWLIIFSIGAGTFLLRFSFIWVLGRKEVRPEIQRILRLVPAAVLSALVVPSFFLTQSTDFLWLNHRMWAGIVAAIIATKSRSVLLTIAAGMGTLWLFTYLLPN